MYDYVFYCAIDPEKRIEYAECSFKIIKAFGKFISVLFPVDNRNGGPPFSVNPVEFYENFSRHLKLEFSSRMLIQLSPEREKRFYKFMLRQMIKFDY